ncbi:MAG: hypothetical protein HRT64_13400 [Erythrobacter sp.]|nr:hypothetical protein [Erythrobacter sp.]
MSHEIIHTAHDLGLGVSFGAGRDVRVPGTCWVYVGGGITALVWEVVGTGKPLLLITFEEAETVRVLDETWLSTETHPDRWEGIDGSFARTVVGSEYPTSRDLMEQISGPITHYQFVTMATCVDVLAGDQPKASFVDRDELERFRIGYIA